MTATDELRRMLDERGVEWRAWDGVHPITVWHDEQCVYEYMERTLLDGVKPHTGEVVDGTGRLEAVIHVCSPEQAVEATLGRRTTTRHGKFRTKYGRSVPCCECCGYGIGDARWNYCPSCGAEVMDG